MRSCSEKCWLLLLGIIVAVMLAACAPRKTGLPPRPVEQAQPQPQPQPEPKVQPKPQAKVQPKPKPVAVSPAAAPLLASARQSLARNDLPGAESYLERAIRLEGGNGLLWHTLAKTKERQGDYRQAVQLALRANALLPAGDPLVRANYLLMERAYRKLGQNEQASQAAAKAQTL